MKRTGWSDLKKWLHYCVYCEKKHYFEISTCLSCGIYEVARPVSETACRFSYKYERCDGCQSYDEHLR